MKAFHQSNQPVVLEDLDQGADRFLSLPGWPRLDLVHATVDNRGPSGGPHRACHSHAVFHAVVVISGRGSFLVDDAVVAVDGPTLFLLSPWQPHSFQRGVADDSVYSEVTFQAADGSDPGDWNELLARWAGLPVDLPAVQAVPRQFAMVLRALIGRIADPSLPGRAHGGAVARGFLAQVVFEIWSQLALRGEDPDADPLEVARRYLEANAHRHVDLAEFAAELGWTPKHAGRAFRQRFGQPPMQYHRACCLRRAATLLRTTGHPLKQVAAMCGFDDAHYFNRCFRRTYGIAPGGYRARYVAT